MIPVSSGGRQIRRVEDAACFPTGPYSAIGSVQVSRRGWVKEVSEFFLCPVRTDKILMRKAVRRARWRKIRRSAPIDGRHARYATEEIGPFGLGHGCRNGKVGE